MLFVASNALPIADDGGNTTNKTIIVVLSNYDFICSNESKMEWIAEQLLLSIQSISRAFASSHSLQCIKCPAYPMDDEKTALFAVRVCAVYRVFRCV